MRRTALAFSLAFLSAVLPAQAARPDPLAVAASIKWYGQNDLRIPLAGKIIWIDPIHVKINEKADIVLITNNRQDHYMSSRVKKLKGRTTRVFVAFDDPDYGRMQSGDAIEVGGILIEAVPAYGAASKLYPKSAGYCGFILYGGGTSVYVAGSTGRIPEMKGLRVDIALLPIGPSYTMASVDDAVQAALDVKAKVAIPVQYGMTEGTEADAARFVAELKAKGVEAIRLPRSQ